MWVVGFVVDVVPSPKFHNIVVDVLVLVNSTDNGSQPLVILLVKFTGGLGLTETIASSEAVQPFNVTVTL